jgi:hypothetical protein
LIWYPYGDSSEFPELGNGGRTAMAGPVYHFDPALDSDNTLPAYFDDTLIMYEWSRSRFWEVKLDDEGRLLKINPLFSALSFNRPMDVELGPDGAMYVLEWGTNFGGNNADAKLVRVEFVGHLPGLPGDYNRNREVDAADYVAWRNTLGQPVTTAFSGADGDGDRRVDQGDYDVWRANFGRTRPQSAAASLASIGVNQPQVDRDQEVAGESNGDARGIPRVDTPSAGGSVATSMERIGLVLSSPARRPALRATDTLVTARQDDALLAWLSSADKNDDDRDTHEPQTVIDDEESKPFTRSTWDAVFASLEIAAATALVR